MKGSPPKHTELKTDVIGQENILFASASVHLSARNFLQDGAVKGLINGTLSAEGCKFLRPHHVSTVAGGAEH